MRNTEVGKGGLGARMPAATVATGVVCTGTCSTNDDKARAGDLSAITRTSAG